MNSRSSINPAQSHAAGLNGLHGFEISLSLPGRQALLVHQLFNESLHGIRGIQYETQIGMSEAELHVLFDEFDLWAEAQERDANGVMVIREEDALPRETFERRYSPGEIRSLRNMAEVVMLDLGQHDFQTRTGFYLVDAKRLLDELNAVLLEPLHLDQQTTPVAH